AHRKAVAAILVIGATALFTTVSIVLSRYRDVGEGLLVATRPPRSSMSLLGSADAFAIRNAIGSMSAWAAGVGAAGLVFGLLANDVAKFIASSSGFEQFASRLGATRAFTAAAFIGIMLSFFVVPITLFVASQMA